MEKKEESSYNKLRKIIETCYDAKESPEELRSAVRAIIEATGMSDQSIKEKHEDEKNYELVTLVSDKEFAMQMLVIAIAFHATTLLEEDIDELPKYLEIVSGIRKKVDILCELYDKNDESEQEENAVRRELCVELLLRGVFEGEPVYYFPRPSEEIKRTIITKKLKSLFTAMIKSSRVQGALYSIDNSRKSAKKCRTEKEPDEITEKLLNVDAYYLVDMAFMNKNSYSAYTTFGGSVLINKNNIKGDEGTKLAVTALLMVHEIAHFKRKIIVDQGNLFKSTPKKLGSESGHFMEARICKNLRETLNYLLTSADVQEKHVKDFCKDIIKAKNWKSDKICEICCEFYKNHIPVAAARKKEHKRVKVAHRGIVEGTTTKRSMCGVGFMRITPPGRHSATDTPLEPSRKQSPV